MRFRNRGFVPVPVTCGRRYPQLGVNTFDRVEAGDHEQVVFCHDRATGLRAVIAIHSTALGPSLGGHRRFRASEVRQYLEQAERSEIM